MRRIFRCPLWFGSLDSVHELLLSVVENSLHQRNEKFRRNFNLPKDGRVRRWAFKRGSALVFIDLLERAINLLLV